MLAEEEGLVKTIDNCLSVSQMSLTDFFKTYAQSVTIALISVPLSGVPRQ